MVSGIVVGQSCWGRVFVIVVRVDPLNHEWLQRSRMVVMNEVEAASWRGAAAEQQRSGFTANQCHPKVAKSNLSGRGPPLGGGGPRPQGRAGVSH